MISRSSRVILDPGKVKNNCYTKEVKHLEYFGVTLMKRNQEVQEIGKRVEKEVIWQDVCYEC